MSDAAAPLPNFSFVRPGQLAGMGKPVSAAQVAALAVEHNVGLVVSLGAPAPDALFVAAADVQRLAIPWPDGGVPTTDDMARAVAEAAKVSGGGKAVVFHCGHGKGRTGTALASYLVLRTSPSAAAWGGPGRHGTRARVRTG